MDEQWDAKFSLPRNVSRNPSKDPQYLRKQELLEECKRRVGSLSSRKRPINIAILGPPGCGKSAFLNTVFASFSNECWKEHAKCGDFQQFGKQVTRRLKRYTKEIYYSENDNILMPTFLDMTGFENENTELNTELLEIILSGKMEDNEILSDVVRYGQEYGVPALRRKYASQPVQTKKVDRIIVVCSLNPKSNLPSIFLEALEDIATSKDITVYGVLTHADKFSADQDEEVKNREGRFRQLLGLTKTRFARVANYCSDVDPSLTYEDTIIPSLDVPVLRLMRQVLSKEAKFTDVNHQGRNWNPGIFVMMMMITVVVCVIKYIDWCYSHRSRGFFGLLLTVFEEDISIEEFFSQRRKYCI